jgi:hypothetical protein
MADLGRGMRRRLGRAIGGMGGDDSPAAPKSQSTTSPTGKGPTLGKMKRAKPPNVYGRGPLLASGRLGVVLVAIVKNEADYLEEWLAYHYALGVEHFLIYDNGSTDDTPALLERYINHGLVTYIAWPMRAGQISAYNHALRMFGETARWLAYYDPDEFLVPLQDDDIPSFLARFEDYATVRVPRYEFGYSGHRTPPDALTIEAYTQVANVLDLDVELPPRVKSIVQPRAVSAAAVHLSFPADDPEPGQPTATAEVEVRGLARLNHYYTRSFEEFEAKRFRGSATGRPARPAVPWETPTIEIDTSAHRFVERTQVALGHLRQLEPRPYNYGSELGFEWFPRPNNLFRFGEYAVANFASGLEEPARFATVRLKNKYTGVGMVSDIASDGFTPVRGAFASSNHTDALLDHLGGRRETSLWTADPPVMAALGTLAVPDEGAASLLLADGVAELMVPLPEDEVLRCYALAFLLDSPARTKVAVTVQRREGDEGEPVRFKLPATRAAAGVVEVEPLPRHGASLRLRFECEAEEIGIYDLFVISYG